MAQKSDDLIEWLLDEIVFSGKDGVSSSQLVALIHNFYDKANAHESDAAEGEARKQKAQPLIDRTFKAHIWKTLVDHPEIVVGDSQNENHLGFSANEALPTQLGRPSTPSHQSFTSTGDITRSHHESSHPLQDDIDDPSSPSAQLLQQLQPQPSRSSTERVSSTENNAAGQDVEDTSLLGDDDAVDLIAFDDNDALDFDFSDDEPRSGRELSSAHFKVPKSQLRIHASTNLIWRTIAGHEADFRKISRSEWECLYVIALARNNGIMQQDLLKATGKDERSVSSYTGNLIERGYIVGKNNTTSSGHGTILFILARFLSTSSRSRTESTSQGSLATFAAPQITAEKAMRPESSKINVDKPNVTQNPPRRRGRPPKAKISGDIHIALSPAELPQSTSSQPTHFPKKRRGRPPISRSTFTSYDEYQRAAGLPGVYLDLPEYNQKTIQSTGKSKIQKMVLFKSEKLKSLPWMRDSPVPAQVIGAGMPEPDTTHSLVGRDGGNAENSADTKRGFDTDSEALDDRPPRKKIILDVVRNFGPSPVSYHSPYQSAPSPSYVSPYQTTVSSQAAYVPRNGSPRYTITNSMPKKQYKSPYSNVEVSPSPPARQGLPRETSNLSSPFMPFQKASVPHTLHKPLAEGPQISEQSYGGSSTSSTAQQEAQKSAVAVHLPARSEDPSAMSSEAAIDEQLAAKIQLAAGAEIPDVSFRIPASKNGVPGNFCLSTDRQFLKFVPSGEQSTLSNVTIRVSDIIMPPQMNATELGTMELRIAAADHESVESIYIFKCLSTESAIVNLNNMRSKIVTAMTIIEFQRDDVEFTERHQAVEKPFQCIKCGSRWKNVEGMKYHLTRSQTACNPNYTMSKKPRKKRRKRSTDENQEKGFSVGDDLVDEIDQMLDNVPYPGDTTESHQNLQVQNTVGQITRDNNFARKNSLQIPQNLPPHQTKISAKPAVTSGFNRASVNEPSYEQRKGIIKGLLSANGQVFPGEQSLWFAYVAAWLQNFPNYELPSYKDCSAAIDLLVDTGQIRKIEFSFRDSVGIMRTRTAVVRNDVSPTSAEVVKLKEMIKTSYPEFYIPTGFAPPNHIQSLLQAPLDAISNSDLPNTGGIIDSTGKMVSTSYPNMTTRSGRVSRRPQRLSHVEDGLALYAKEATLDSDDDDYSSNGTTQKGLQPRRFFPSNEQTEDDRGKKIGPSSNNEHVENTMDLKGRILRTESSLTPLSQTPGDEEQETDSEMPHQTKIWKRYRRFERSFVLSQVWQTASTFLQEENGAWSTLTPRRLRRVYFRPRLPEPVTYMQTLNNPAWEFRPFGHGVHPIHTRPSKWTEGNPQHQAYSSRILGGFRPVIMPRVRKYGPALPSKNISISSAIADVPLVIADVPLVIADVPLVIADVPSVIADVPSPLVAAKKRRRPRNTSKLAENEVGTTPPPKRRQGEQSKRLAVVSSSPMTLPRPSLVSRQDFVANESVPHPQSSKVESAKNIAILEVGPPSVSFGQGRLPHLGPKRAAVALRNPGLGSLPYPLRRQGILIQSTLQKSNFAGPTIHFLPPNKLLNDGPGDLETIFPPSAGEPSATHATAASSKDVAKELQKTIDARSDVNFSIRWQESKILTSKQGVWPTFNVNEFDDGSFTVQGWFPSRAFTLSQLLPANLDEIIMSKNIPPKDFFSTVDEVAAWEQGDGKVLLELGTVTPDYIFIHLNTTPSDHYGPVAHRFRWLSRNAFTLESIPYEKLEDDGENETTIVTKAADQTPSRRMKMPMKIPKKIPKKILKKIPKRSITQNMLATRRLTALPGDLDGIITSIADDPELAVEVAFQHHQNLPRRRSKEGYVPLAVEYRLMVAVVVIRTLTGGLDKQIDWVLVSRLFPIYPMNFVQKRWAALAPKHKHTIERLGTNFQSFFVEAYRSGKIPAIDYDHLVGYDWAGLVDLVVDKVDVNDSPPNFQLPVARSHLNQMYHLIESYDQRPWRDDFFGQHNPVHKRVGSAASDHYTLPVAQGRIENSPIDDSTIARSWVRASTLTPEIVYDKDFAAEKLATLKPGLAKAAIHELLKSKVIMYRNKGRPMPGRGFEITDTFTSSLKKYIDEHHLTQAVAFKESLDTRFRESEIAMVEWTVDEGEILAITNLHAHGRIRLAPRNVPINRFGLTDGDYQTKRMDKARLRFDMQILPTSSYLNTADVPILDKSSLHYSSSDLNLPTSNFRHTIPPHGPRDAIPIWYDTSLKLIPTMWKKVLCAVLGTIAMRPGIKAAELARIFSPAMEEWEIRVLAEWCVGVGALSRIAEDRKDFGWPGKGKQKVDGAGEDEVKVEGWRTAEWWWLVGGREWEAG